MGKSILFIAPIFHDYTRLIIEGLEKLDYDVTFLENKMFPSDPNCTTWKFNAYLNKIKHPKEKEEYVQKMKTKIKDINFEILFVINGFSITKDLIKYIELHNPGIKKTIFFWDSFCYWQYNNIIDLFDYKWSFDHHDCKTYRLEGLKYHPDFIVGDSSLKSNNLNENFDIVHIGSVNVFSISRIKILAQIKKYCDQNNINNYIKIFFNEKKLFRNHKKRVFLQLLTSHRYRKLYYYYWKYRNSGIFLDDVLPYKEVVNIESNAKAIIDIPLEKQCGCTIRSLETINRNQKLITTNFSIVQDRFYDNNNILIIQNKKHWPIKQFLANRNEGIDIKYLLIENWCKSILNS